ncbi:MAG: hypothetical protein GXY83_14155, partial [Rhodopirellula sp.]|nr:hypothetical protein [Rhodopirellula sp.]
ADQSRFSVLGSNLVLTDGVLDFEAKSSYEVQVTATDGGTPGLLYSNIFTISVTDVNDAPAITSDGGGAIAGKSIAENTTAVTTVTATDADLPPQTLAYSISGGSEAATFTINSSTGVLAFASAPDFENPADVDHDNVYEVTVQVTDVNGGTDTQAIRVSVTDVNEAPTGSVTIDDTTPAEDQLLTASNTLADADGLGTITYRWERADDAAFDAGVVTVGTGRTFTPRDAEVGKYLRVTAGYTDDHGTAESVGSAVTDAVADVNVAPVLAAIGNKTVDEQATLAFQATAIDQDLPAQAFFFSLDAGSLAAGMSITPAGEFAWTPTEAQGDADYTVTITVTDDGAPALGDSETFTISVDEVNIAPVLGPIGNRSVNEQTLLSFGATATDQDLPAQAFSFSLDAGSLAAGMSITAAGEFSWTPTEAQGGADYTVTITVTDDGEPTLTDSETITITVNEVNTAPSFTLGDNLSVLEDCGAWSVLGWASEISAGPGDESAQGLTFLLTTDDEDLFAEVPAIDPATGTLTFTPAPDAFGTAMIAVRLKDDGGTEHDGSDTSAEQTFTIMISPVNDPPSFVNGGGQAVDEDSGEHATAGWATVIWPGAANEWGQGLEFLILIENDDLFAILPSIDALTGELTFEPAPNAVGTAIITVQLKDDGGTDNGGSDLSSEETFTITLNPVNDPPTLVHTVADRTTPQNAPFSYTFPADTFEDVDGDPLTYAATTADGSPLPSWLAFHPATRTLSGTPANEDVGTVDITLTATDPVGESAEDRFQVTVTNVNDPPVSDAGGPYRVSLTGDLLLDGSGSYDPDAAFGDSIRFYRWDIGERGIWAYSGVQPTVPWEDLAGFAWDTAVTVRLEVTDSFGVSASSTTELTIGSPVDLGPIDFTEFSSPDLSGGDAWYRLAASRRGWLTVEALREDVELTLLDQSLGVLRTSSASGGIQRLDEPAVEGETFFVRLSGSGTADLRIANLVRHDGNSVTVHGTAEADQLTFDASAGHKITINGLDYPFTQAEATTFSFDGLGGSDDVRFIGSGGSDNATLYPTRGTFSGESYTLDVANIESIDYDGGAGDTVTIWGSAGVNTYRVEPGAGEMTGDGVSISVAAETIYARGGGGSDAVWFTDSEGDDLLQYFPRWATMSGEGYFNQVNAFKVMYADAERGAGGTDTVIFRG